MIVKGMKRFLLVAFLLLALFYPPLAAAEKAKAAAQYIPPEPVRSVSPLQIAGVDFLLPGYGTWVQKKNGFAALYFSANIASLSMIYIAWRNWRFYESAYEAAALRQASEPDKLLFQDPSGGSSFYSLQDIKNRAERGQLFFAISIVANLVLRGFSAWHSWSLADEALMKSGPRYEFYPDASGGFKAQGGYYFYF